MKKKKISIALSSGIDSTASTIILKKCGFFLEAFFMKNWEHETKLNCNRKELTYLKNICKQIKINIKITNFSKEYWENVFIPFIKNIKNGETPNPDITCNKKIKFNKLLNEVLIKKNFNSLATGHYAKIKKIKKYKLFTSFDKKKDQTYFLYTIKTNIMKNLLLPLANYTKKKVKIYIKYYSIINYNKKESMGICFIEEKNIKNFINKFIYKNIGNIKINNKIIGKHDGIQFYTLGEKKNIKNKKIYIYKKNSTTNTIHITKNIKKLANLKIDINKNLNNLNKFICKAKIRHQENFNTCILIKNKRKFKIIFKIKQIAITPGQHIVLYKLNECIGGYKLNGLNNN
ncbi:MAG TPA: tRNA 2-thiouridine(34) synthase MnmA [Candidatus Azoamicus sp. MARI]